MSALVLNTQQKSVAGTAVQDRAAFGLPGWGEGQHGGPSLLYDPQVRALKAMATTGSHHDVITTVYVDEEHRPIGAIAFYGGLCVPSTRPTMDCDRWVKGGIQNTVGTDLEGREGGREHPGL